jgi:chitodextrinase
MWRIWGRPPIKAMRVSMLLFLLSSGSSPVSAQIVSLPPFNVDINQTSVSGLSSGGYMAVQFHVAFSSIMKGAGIIAGGPYFCAQDDQNIATSTCSCSGFLACQPGAVSTSVPALINETDTEAAAGAVDATNHLADSRIWLFSGNLDSVVPTTVMDALQAYYTHYATPSNLSFRKDIAAEHAMPTDSFGNSCATKGDPFINNCDFDAAGELLQWIYGPLNPRNTGVLGGSFIEFDQGAFISAPESHGMWRTGWAYVPASCASGALCRVHVVFHGCKQFPGWTFPGGPGGEIGDTYVKKTGYNSWADTNNIVVLYPQANAMTVGTRLPKSNPLGCWDWWGYDDASYAVKTGRQMAAIKSMIDRIASGHSALPAPTGVKVTASADTTISLTWDPMPSASGFSVYRNTVRVNSNPVLGTSFTDTGLSPGTTYSYTVKAIDSSGAESAASNPVEGKTTGVSSGPAPTDLKVSAVTASSVTLSWAAPSGVAGFDVFRATSAAGPYSKVNASLIANANFTDTGLVANTTYFFTVKSESASGALSPASVEVTATTQPAPTCFTATNFDHVRAGRAHDNFSIALANGSNQVMGLDNVFVVTTLKQTGPNFYVIDSCS